MDGDNIRIYKLLSSVLNERGYHVQWACDDLLTEYQRLQEYCDVLLRELKEKEQEIYSLKNDQKEESDEETVVAERDEIIQNTTKIKNIKKYMLTMLFNASTTIEGYYRATVNYDMPQFAG